MNQTEKRMVRPAQKDRPHWPVGITGKNHRVHDREIIQPQKKNTSHPITRIMVTPSELRFGKRLSELQISDIEFLVQNKIEESHNLEYKGPSENLQEECNYLAKAISGFLNTDGGILLYGVSEKKVGKHRYPDVIEGCNSPKETLENLLKSRVQPWKENIKIMRIDMEKEEEKWIFVIEVPKSDNPPHMHNFIYYQRLNFQTEPMSHQNVFRAFQTSWIRQKDLYQNVLEPLYAEIKDNCEKIENYRQGSSHKYDNIIKVNRYLYDQIELPLGKKIEDFYRRMKELNSWLAWTDRIAVRIINEELSRIFPEKRDRIERHMDIDCLRIRVKVKYPDGHIKTIVHQNALARALSLGVTMESFLQSSYSNAEILEYEPLLFLPPEEDTAIPDQTFRELRSSCRSKATEDKAYISIRKEMPKISTLGRQILRSILGR